MKKQLIGVSVAAYIFGAVTWSSATFITTAPGIKDMEWLPYWDTFNMSRDEVTTTYLQEGQAYYGFRYASVKETQLLFQSYIDEIPPDYTGSLSDESLAAFAFLQDYDYQYGTVEGDVSWLLSGFMYGAENELPEPGKTWIGVSTVEYDTNGSIGPDYDLSRVLSGETELPCGTYFSNSSSPEISSLLVRELSPIPEPATMLIFGTGLVGLLGSRLRKQKK